MDLEILLASENLDLARPERCPDGIARAGPGSRPGKNPPLHVRRNRARRCVLPAYKTRSVSAVDGARPVGTHLAVGSGFLAFL